MVSKNENHNRLNAFFKEEYHSLKKYVTSKIEDAAHRDAGDVVQDVAFKLFSRADSLSPIDNVAGYVYNAIRNAVVDLMRTRKKHVGFEDEMEMKLVAFTEVLYGVSANSYSGEMQKNLKSAIANLKPHYRDVVIAIDFEGYTYTALSQETSIPTGTLMSRRHRALSILYKTLQTKNLN